VVVVVLVVVRRMWRFLQRLSFFFYGLHSEVFGLRAKVWNLCGPVLLGC
jgi:hypothetical protein